MKQSTKLMFRRHGWRVDRFVHNYLYFLYYAPYVKTVGMSLTLLKRLLWLKPISYLGRFVFDRYHAKVLSQSDATKILTLDRNINVVDERNKSIIPYRYANKIILQEPDFIVAMDCPCKKANGKTAEDPCAPQSSCIAVGRAIGSFWLDHCQKYNAHRITQQEALAIVRRYRRTGHITQAFFKVATGGSTGVVCNCCPACCVSLQATLLTRKLDPTLLQSAPSGYSVVVDRDACIACGHCSEACHFDAVKHGDGGRRYDRSACFGCELCVESCPQSALSLQIDTSKPLPLDLDRLPQPGLPFPMPAPSAGRE